VPLDADRARSVLAAVQAVGPAERAAVLERECGADAALRRQVEALLNEREHRAADPEVIIPAGATVGEPPSTEGPRGRVGRYKLLQQIGEGGMGVVFLAEQTGPVRREVALKLIKPGMDSREVIGRFEAERQALALMDHPNIARVLDAGTDAGRPFFVMELVKGVPITTFCDKERLNPSQRLALFEAVCQAVQHAHQKGIIHRDLKPSNVLIARFDGKPVPKIIDFGVAKATGQKLTERTLFTGFGSVVGTLEYMSPEQAEPDQPDIDTRSDIYALGVLLYELLTGMTPLDRARLRAAALLESLRIIREEEPPRPSTRLSTTDELPRIAERRGVEPKKLSGLLRGDLDWVVMKCLEKDRNRRYETANGLARDVQRYLDGEPVSARPPTAIYRFRKFVTRNRRWLVPAAFVAFVVLLAAGGVGWALWDRSVQSAVRRADLETATEAAMTKALELRRQARWGEARVALEQARDRLEHDGGPADLRRQVNDDLAGLTFVGRLEDIRLDRMNIVDELFDYNGARRGYEATFREAGVNVEADAPDAAAARVRASSVSEALVAAVDDWAAVAENDRRRAWLLAVARGADPDPWRDRVRDPTVWRDRTRLEALSKDLLAHPDDLARQKPQLLAAFATALENAGGERVAFLSAAQARYPNDLWLNLGLAEALQYVAKKQEAAVGFYRAAVAIRPSAAAVHTKLSHAVRVLNRLDEAILEGRRGVEIDPGYGSAHANLGLALCDKGLLLEGIQELRRGVELDPNNASMHFSYAYGLGAGRQRDASIAEYQRAVAIQPRLSGGYRFLGEALDAAKRPAEAEAAFRRAVEVNPKDPWAHLRLGNMLRDRGQLSDADREYRRGIELDPTEAWAHVYLGENFREDNRFVEAAHEYRRAIELSPELPRAHLYLGHALARVGRLTDAVSAYRQAIRLDPENRPKAASSLSEQGLSERAIADCRRFVQESAAGAEAHADLATVLRLADQTEAAIGEWKLAIRFTPDDAWLHLDIAETFRDAGRVDEAIREYRRVVELDPRSRGFQARLGRALMQARRFVDAEGALARAFELGSQDGFGRTLAADLSDCKTALARMRREAAEKVALFAGGEKDGDGIAAREARLRMPYGMTFDRVGCAIVAECGADRVRKIDRNGVVTILAGTGERGFGGDGGPATAAQFNQPHALAISPKDGHLYITDTFNARVRKIDATTGIVSTVAGTGERGLGGDGGPAVRATFGPIISIAFDPHGERMYLADVDNRRVRVVDMATGVVSTFAGNGEKGVPVNGADAAASPLGDVRAVAVDPTGLVYFLERSGHALRVVDGRGKIRTLIRPGNGKPARAEALNVGWALCFDRDGNILIADGNQIHRYVLKDDRLELLAGVADEGPQIFLDLRQPRGVAVDAAGRIYICDSYNNRILKIK
jgi:tetratricopeptide (TPR) repeat protein/DNA-binding beta-propeller fold protein YncE